MDGLSLRSLIERYDCDRDTGSKILNEILSNLKPCSQITKELVDPQNYSGNLIVDGKFVPCKEEIKKTEEDFIPRSKKRRKIKNGMVWIPFSDYHSHDIPELITARSENVIDFKRGFESLKLLDYPLVSATMDKNGRAVSALFQVFKDALLQYCIKHYLSEIQRKLSILSFRRTLKSIEKKIEDLNYDGKALLRRRSRQKTIRLINQYLKLDFQYENLNDFYETMVEMLYAKDIKQRDGKKRYLESTFFLKHFPLETSKTYRKRIIKVYEQFKEDERYLFTSLEHPGLNIPKTTNLNEGYNNQLENRIFSIRGFETIKTCKDYGNALILKRRFKKFTDCKKNFKHLNGKSPLEIVGVKTDKIKDWIRFSLSKKRQKK